MTASGKIRSLQMALWPATETWQEELVLLAHGASRLKAKNNRDMSRDLLLLFTSLAKNRAPLPPVLSPTVSRATLLLPTAIASCSDRRVRLADHLQHELRARRKDQQRTIQVRSAMPSKPCRECHEFFGQRCASTESSWRDAGQTVVGTVPLPAATRMDEMGITSP